MDKNIITIIVVALGLVAPISVFLLGRILKSYDEQIKNLRDSVDKLFQLDRDHVRDYHKHEE